MLQLVMSFVSSTNYMVFLLCQYVILVMLCAVEREWGRCVYFLGAAVITVGVLMMAVVTKK